MKNLLLLLSALVGLNASAGDSTPLSQWAQFSHEGWNGCYYVYDPGISFPALCVQPNFDKDPSGQTLQVALWSYNEVHWCSEVSSAQESGKQATYKFQAPSAILKVALKAKTSNSSELSGEIQIVEGSKTHQLQFLKMGWQHVSPNMATMFDSAACKP